MYLLYVCTYYMYYVLICTYIYILHMSALLLLFLLKKELEREGKEGNKTSHAFSS